MDQSELLGYLVEVFESLGITYFITGSVASIFYGEPRFTNDIDVVTDIQEKHIKSLLRLFKEDDFYISGEAMKKAIDRRIQFNIIHPASGLKIDVIICKKNTYDDTRFKRIKRISPIKDKMANFSSPEDVIIMKMKYYKEGNSEKHLRDIAGILKISRDIVDMDYIQKWVTKFGLSDIWENIKEKIRK